MLGSFKTRKLTTFITVAGITLVVYVFAVVLMMAYGVQKTLIATGSDDNVKITRKAANGEISSIIDPETQEVVRTLPHIAKSADGKDIWSAEPVVIVNLEKVDGGLSNVTIRGVSPEYKELHPQVKLISGRFFNFGVRELIVGKAITKRFKGAQIGSTVKFAGDNWKIVGTFDTDGTGFDSELWGDALQLLNAFHRGHTVSTITLKLDNMSNFENFKRAFSTDRRLQQFEPKSEKAFFAEQSEQLSLFISILGIFVTVIFSFGATIGAMITMYANVANRTVEIGTMRSLGFKRRSILSAFLFESLLIAIVGAIIGIALASLMQFFSISTLNFQSFADITFTFAMNPVIIVSSLLFSVFMGILGGFLPAVRAARMNIVSALRAE
jgi:ABC-type antimicrobial peptide transport system permease subunit